MGNTTLQEVTTEADRGNAFRNFVLTHEDEFKRDLISVTAHHAENIGPGDELPTYMVLPHSVMTNFELAQVLLKLAGSLLERPKLVQIPSESLPPTHRPACCEG